MNDVSVVEVSHEDEADEGEDEGAELFPVGRPLRRVEQRPHQMIDPQDQEEREVRWGQVEDEALLVGGWNEMGQIRIMVAASFGSMSKLVRYSKV